MLSTISGPAVEHDNITENAMIVTARGRKPANNHTVLALLGIILSLALVAGLTFLAPPALSPQIQDTFWEPVPGTRLVDACPQSEIFGYDYKNRCKAVVLAWSGAALDPGTQTLYIWGGGHQDYYGNEVYALTPRPNGLNRLTQPAAPADPDAKPAQRELAPFNGTQPNSRHTYGGLAFLANHGVLWAYSGDLAGKHGPFTDRLTWIFDPRSKRWHRDNASGDMPPASNGVVSAYDPVTGDVFLHTRRGFYKYSYSPSGGTYSLLNKRSGIKLGVTAVIDPVRRKMLLVGNGQHTLLDLDPSSGYRRSRVPISGDGDFVKKFSAPGLAYNTLDKHIYAWPGDGRVYRFDMDTLSWTGLALNGDPGPQSRKGTFGRFAYLPDSDRFLLLNNPNRDAYLLTLPSVPDVTPPGTPRRLQASHPYPGSLQIDWKGAIDNVGVNFYELFINATSVGSVDGTTYKSMAYKAGDKLNVSIVALDSAGNSSVPSKTLALEIPAANPRMRMGDCSGESELKTRKDVVFCEPWESDKWWQQKGYLSDPIVADPRPMTQKTAQHTSVVSTGCVQGKCLKVKLVKGQNKALSAYWAFASARLAPQQVFMRYYLRLGNDWDARMCTPSGRVRGAGGKFPGLADTRTWADPSGQCGNGGASADGLSCWSMRLNFRDCDGQKVCKHQPAADLRLGSYLYYPLQRESTGTIGSWFTSPSKEPSTGKTCLNNPKDLRCGIGLGGLLERDRWHRIEMQTTMNTPGQANGIVRGWVDGELSYEKTNMIFRDEGHDFLHNRLAWLNIYKGGTNGNCETSHIFMDQMVLALDRPVGGVATESRTRIPRARAAKAAVQKAQPITPQTDDRMTGKRSVTAGKSVSSIGSSRLELSATIVGSGRVKLAWSGAEPTPSNEESGRYYIYANGSLKARSSHADAVFDYPPTGAHIKYQVERRSRLADRPLRSDTIKAALPGATKKGSTLRLKPDMDTYLAASTFKPLGKSKTLSLGKARNILLKFPVEALPDAPSLQKAILRLSATKVYGGTSVSAFLVSKDWHEDVATREFADRTLGTSWSRQLGDWTDRRGVGHGSQHYSGIKINEKDKLDVEIDITELTRAWQQGSPNYGVLLRAQGTGSVSFSSKESIDSSNHPALEITF